MAPTRGKREALAKRRTAAKRTYWSGRVTQTSNALDLRARIFTSRDPRRIALSLKRSAESSKRRKGTPYQSAMSMLNFYINRAGKALPARQKAVLQRAKQELRKAFGRA
jgi:putative cell wall-binding protein